MYTILENHPTVILCQHNTVHCNEATLAATIPTVTLCIGASISLLHCLLGWLCLNTYYELVQKLYVKMSVMPSKERSMHSSSPFSFPAGSREWNMIAGARVTILGPEAGAIVENNSNEMQRTCVPDTVELLSTYSYCCPPTVLST